MEITNFIAHLENYGSCVIDNEYVKGEYSMCKKDDCYFIDVDISCIYYPYDFVRVFERFHSVSFTLKLNRPDKLLAQHIFRPFWVEPAFCDKTTDIPDNCQYLLTKSGENNSFFIPVANKNYQTLIQKGASDDEIEIVINAISPGKLKIKGSIMVISEDINPYKAIEKGFETSTKHGIIKTPLKNGKQYPDVLNKLGWCTWNAFYHDVSEDGILSKMQEFKAKNIPVRWVLIDDGWSEVNEDMTLKSIYEDKTKFPQGLKGTIEILKRDYGVESVGVWHSATGYWHGLGFEDETTFNTAFAINLPKGYEFFSKWHSYLKEQGVDFVKVDCQGNITEYVKSESNALKKVLAIQEGIEQSAHENFDFMINCMGMVNINMFNRSLSAVCRNSDDFYPMDENSLKSHVLQNAYNAVFTDMLFYCDYDMWWSKHFQARQNAALRAVSGGPFYLSDKLGESDGELINSFLDAGGNRTQYDAAAKPTYDCLYGFDDVLKIFNTKGDNVVVAVFSFQNSGKVNLSAGDFGRKGKYMVKEKSENKEWVLDFGETLTLTLNEYDVIIFEFTLIDSK